MINIFSNLTKYQKTKVIRENDEPITPVTKTDKELKRQRREEKWNKVKEVCLSIMGIALVLLLYGAPFIFSEEDILPFAIGYFVIFIFLPLLTILIGIAVTFVEAYTNVKWKIVLGSIILFVLMIGAIAIFSYVGEKSEYDRNYEYMDSHRPDKW